MHDAFLFARTDQLKLKSNAVTEILNLLFKIGTAERKGAAIKQSTFAPIKLLYRVIQQFQFHRLNPFDKRNERSYRGGKVGVNESPQGRRCICRINNELCFAIIVTSFVLREFRELRTTESVLISLLRGYSRPAAHTPSQPVGVGLCVLSWKA